MTNLPDGCIEFYWLVTIETDHGRRITCDGTMPADTRHHTRMSTTRAVMDSLRKKHGGFTVLCFELAPNSLAGLA
jgi:hypothetical protein